MNKIVSIIMGIYNCEKTVADSIRSIQNQTYQHWELIVCDDGSTDHSYHILLEFAEKDNRIKVLKNEQNCGLASTLNHCFKYSNGDYVMRHDGDDIMVPNRMAKQVEYMKDHNCDVCGSWAYLFDNDNVWGMRKLVPEPNKETMIWGAPFVHPTVMMKREVLLDVEGYSNNKITRQRLEDYDLWLKFYEKDYILHNIQEPLIYFREDRFSYNRKSKRFRITETLARLDACKRLNIPLYKRILAFKPLILILVPIKALRTYRLWQEGKREVEEIKNS